MPNSLHLRVRHRFRILQRLALGVSALAVISAMAPISGHAAEEGARSRASRDLEPIVLREGDELQITFPGAPSLNTQQKIRSDGRITLSLLGEIVATDMTPTELQSRLIELYASQLVSREVTVTLVSRSFYVYVNGAVDKHGRLDFDRPVTALEAVMAAGFSDGAVNLKRVTITRNEGGTMRTFTVNLEDAMKGKADDPFLLEQGDMLVVPSRIL